MYLGVGEGKVGTERTQALGREYLWWNLGQSK